MLTKYAKKTIKNYDINTLLYIEEALIESETMPQTHSWYLYLVVNQNNETYIHCYNWNYNFDVNQIKGYNNEHEKILLKDINESSRQDFIEISKKFELNLSS